jgi:hypothetical protein
MFLECGEIVAALGVLGLVRTTKIPLPGPKVFGKNKERLGKIEENQPNTG